MTISKIIVRVSTAFIIALSVACGGSSSSDAVAPVCAAGTTQACLGPGACSGAQACKDDGSGWTACDCGGPDASMGSDGAQEDVASEASPDAAPDATEDTPIATDAPDAAPDGAITPISPGALAGLSLWFDSDKGALLTSDGFLALKWLDQSPHGNTSRLTCGGSCMFGCSTPLTCGLRKLLADTKGGHDAYQVLSYGKIDCCNFTDSILQVDDDASLQFGTGPFAFFIVVKAAGVTAPIDLWGKHASGANLSLVLDASKFEVKTDSASAKLSFASSTSAYRLLVVRGPALTIRADGIEVKGTTSTDDISSPGGTLNIGTPLGPGDRAVMAIAEYVAVKGAVSDAQLLGVEAYLRAKHKTP